jgi:hypothetical protein
MFISFYLIEEKWFSNTGTHIIKGKKLTKTNYIKVQARLLKLATIVRKSGKRKDKEKKSNKRAAPKVLVS